MLTRKQIKEREEQRQAKKGEEQARKEYYKWLRTMSPKKRAKVRESMPTVSLGAVFVESGIARQQRTEIAIAKGKSVAKRRAKVKATRETQPARLIKRA